MQHLQIHLRKYLLTSICIVLSLHVFAQNNDSIPAIDTTNVERKNGLFEKLKIKSPKKKNARPLVQRILKPSYHSPLAATAYSLALPGAGQVYNKKYWKLPIVYGGLGWMSYRVYTTTQDHRTFRQAYIYRIDEDPNTVDEFPLYSDSNLNSIRLSTKKDQELAIIGLSVVYVLVAVDAFVDAHLMSFDINDDLSLGVRPTILAAPNERANIGLSFSFTYR